MRNQNVTSFVGFDKEWFVEQERKGQSISRVTPTPKLNRGLPPRWRSPDSQVATASSVLYLAQAGWVITPALLMTGSTGVQSVCSRSIVNRRNRIRISTFQRRLCVNWFKVLQLLDVHLIVCLIMPLFFQRVINEKLIYNTNRFVLQELWILLVGGVWLWRISGGYSQEVEATELYWISGLIDTDMDTW